MPIAAKALLALIALFAAAPALAQSSSFTGVWRVIRAERAQWVLGAPQVSELLRTGVVIREGQILAHPALIACDKPEFEEDTQFWDDAFGGIGTKAPKRFFDQFTHREGGIKSLRVKCGATQRDFHFSAYDDLFVFDGKHFLTLRKHADSEDNSVATIARREPSFDCTKARTNIERLICDWPDALVADGDAGAEFKRLQKALGKTNADTLLRSQRAFNDYVVKACDLAHYPLRDIQRQREPATCVAGATRTRIEFLSALEVASAGPVRIEPAVTTQSSVRAKSASGVVYEMSSWITHDAKPVLSGAPKPVADAFAQHMRKLLDGGKPLIGERRDLHGSVTRVYKVASLSENFVSLHSLEKVDAGTRVPDRELGLNFDLKEGKPITLDAIFEQSDSWTAAVTEALQKELNYPEKFDAHKKTVLEGGNGVVWLFGKERVSVSWSPEWSGPPEQVDIPAAALAPFVKPSSPWQPDNPDRK